MKKIYLFVMIALACSFANAQIEQTTYRGAFAPGVSMWTDSWTNWNPNAEGYLDAGTTVVNITADITANTTWTAGKTYYLNGLIYVRNNATLTIAPGVVVKGNYTSTGTALVVTKGAKLNAIGTAASPIVFTSAKAAGLRKPADWGGVILLGKSTFNLNGGLNNIEGITATVNTEYGGGTTPDENDNSGTLKYVRIEFGGFVFSPNNEINGLTMGAVGRGTTIDNVQVSFAGDDSFEWFGGTVNCKHLVAFRGLDDDFDTDNGFSGVCQFGLGIRDPQISDNPAISTSEGFESDNNAAGSAVSPYTSCVFSNYTLIGPKYRQTLPSGGTLAIGFKRAARLRRNSKQKIFNSIFLDHLEGLHVDGAAAELNALNDELKWKNNIIAINGATTSTKFLQVNTPGSITVGNTAAFNMQSWYDANGNTSLSSNAGILERVYDTTNAQNYTGLDYRPATGSPALTGASFTDSSLSQYLAVGSLPSVNNVTYCKGAVAAALTAKLTTTGVSLKWYSTAIIVAPLVFVSPVTSPMPLTSTVGTKSYWVSQVDASGIESPRAKIDVIVKASPLVALGTITGTFTAGGSVAPIAVGQYIGTTTQFTYTVPASVEAGVASYLWTVPSGVNIISADKTTNSIVVDFANVPAGAGALGSIQVQAVNDTGCPGTAKTLAITKALPVAPAALKVTLATSTTAITSYAKYMGTTTPLTLTATAVVAASSYKWELPAGVNVITSSAPATTTIYYTAEPFLSPAQQPSTATPPVGTGASSGLKYWAVTYNTYNEVINGVATVITKSTAVQKMIAKSPYNVVADQAYASYGTVITSDMPSILVNFAGVTNAATTVIYLGVKSKNGVGVSVTSNATNVDVVAGATSTPGLFSTVYTETFTAPVPPKTNAGSVYNATGFAASTAKLLKLTATVPAAVTTVTGQILLVCGTGTPYDYTITPSVLASSYIITAPAGSIVTSASAPMNATNVLETSDLVFTVVHNGLVATAADKKYIVIAAKNGVGTSITSKSLTLTTGTCAPPAAKLRSDVVSATEVYPNPVSSDFSIDVTASKAGVLEIGIYSLDGNVAVSARLVKLQGNSNTINENVSSLKKGIYIVRLVNTSNNEVITKKLIKN